MEQPPQESDARSESRIITDPDGLLPLEDRGGKLVVAQTDLCPALLIRARLGRIHLFSDLDAWGLGGPQRVAVPTSDGVEILALGSSKTALDGRRLAEPWILCWFEGGRGWDRLGYGQPCHWRGHHPEKPFPHIDVPWLLVLQRRPDRVALRAVSDAPGPSDLELQFPGDSGTIAAMPLFGVDLAAAEAVRSWREGLPEEIQERCRRWTRFLRRIPVGCHESFSLDETDDTVSVNQVFDYLEIEDEWNTRGETVAPYPPFVLLAERFGFPVKLEEAAGNDELATLWGPYGFRRDSRSATYALRGMLRYIREEEIARAPARSPAAWRAVERLRQMLAEDPRLATKTSGGFTRGLALALTSSARALPYLSEEQKPPVREIMDELVARLLDPSRYLPLMRYPTAGGIEPVGEAICLNSRDAYKVVQANAYGLWAATVATGEWERIRRAWPLIRRWFHLPFQTQWLTPLPARWEGLDVARALFDGTVGFARLAAQLGERGDYRFAGYLFAKLCAGWFAMEHMPRYHRVHQPWLSNTDADYLVWHPCRLNGYVLIANDHLLPHEQPKVDGRGWASAYGRMTPSSARFWRDFLRERADEVLNRLLPRCRPDWAAAGAPTVLRSYVLGESAEQLERYRAADEAAESAAARDVFRLRTYRLFQSTPVLREIATIEAGTQSASSPAVPDVAAMRVSEEGSSRTAGRTEQATFPARIASGDGTGSPPLLYWPGVRTPKKPSVVLDERLDVLPFGSIRAGGATDIDFPSSKVLHPNWCLTVVAHHGKPIEPVTVGQLADGTFDVAWTTPVPGNSIVQFWRHDLSEAAPCVESIEDGRPVCEHHVQLPERPRDALYWFRVLSFDGSGRLHRSNDALLPTERVNWSLGRPAYVSKRFPFKEFKYAPDRNQWLKEYGTGRSSWNVLQPPHELTDGHGLRPGVEPWVRHAEPDPSYRHWIAVDLGATRPVDEVIIAHNPEWVSAGYRVEAGPKDEPWSAALSGAQSPAWNDCLAAETENRSVVSSHRFECRQTRWIRVLYTHPAPVGLSANRLLLWEIEVRGPRER